MKTNHDEQLLIKDFHHHLSAIEHRLSVILYQQDCILCVLSAVLKKEKQIMAVLDDVVVEVTETGTVVDSAVVLLDGLKAALDAAGTDPVKLAEIRTALATKRMSLAEAVARNTVAATEPPAPPA